MKKLQLVVILAGLAVVGSANAALQIVGGLAVGGGGTSTSSSLALTGLELVESSAGDFLPSVQSLSGLSANTSTITGLSATPLAVSISDFFVFSSDLITPGTVPNNRFEFNLATLAETSYSSLLGGVYKGTGTLVDTTGAYAKTPADFTLSFSGADSQSFTLNAEPTPVPEPTTFIAGAFMLLPFGARAFRTLRNGRKV